MLDTTEEALEVETALAEPNGDRIVAKLKEARDQLDMAILDAGSYAIAKQAGRTPEVCESAVTEVVTHTQECHKLTNAALEALTHKETFEIH